MMNLCAVKGSVHFGVGEQTQPDYIDGYGGERKLTPRSSPKRTARNRPTYALALQPGAYGAEATDEQGDIAIEAPDNGALLPETCPRNVRATVDCRVNISRTEPRKLHDFCAFLRDE
jgi:hypothetical protein